MRLSPKTLLAIMILIVGVIGAGIFIRASSMRDAPSVQVASSATAAQTDAVETVRILEQQLAFATADATQFESQRAASRELVFDLTERLRAARTDSSQLAGELEEQLASATAEVARLERQLAVYQEIVGELTDRLRTARAAAGL